MRAALPRTAVDLSTRPDLDVLAAGGVLWSEGERGVEVCVVHRPRYGDWSLPKGKLDRGETMPVAAVREIAEETGYSARLGAYLGEVHYPVVEGRKAVRFWSAEVTGGPGHEPNAETDALRWLAPAEAGALLTYPHERRVLERFTGLGRVSSMLVIVRHAKAGSRSQWDGPDSQRPLSGTGRDQAARLATLLPCFGPDVLVSAPPVRCRDTLLPTAAALPELPAVVDEPLLGEAAFAEAPGSGLTMIRALAARPGVTMVCSQGGVIPAAVTDLLRRSPHAVELDPDTVRAPKASTWVLALRDGELVSADIFSRPTG